MATPTNYQLILYMWQNSVFDTNYQTDMAPSNMTQAQLDAAFAGNPFEILNDSTALPGFCLNRGGGLYSPQHSFRFFFDFDGNVVLQCIQDGVLGPQTGSFVYPNTLQWNTIWSTQSSNGATGDVMIMQEDGNLVLYQKTGRSSSKAVWQTNTSGNPGAFLRMQDDGNLVVYGPNGNALWATNTNARS